MKERDFMSNVIIGTAGHIDHGKTTLIKALSGIETDTMTEEKERGISINLGFAYFDLPSGKRCGVVDVPGHEKFIKNMLVGAVGINLVLLLVDSREGIMPQTKGACRHTVIIRYRKFYNSNDKDRPCRCRLHNPCKRRYRRFYKGDTA